MARQVGEEFVEEVYPSENVQVVQPDQGEPAAVVYAAEVVPEPKIETEGTARAITTFSSALRRVSSFALRAEEAARALTLRMRHARRRSTLQGRPWSMTFQAFQWFPLSFVAFPGIFIQIFAFPLISMLLSGHWAVKVNT